MRVWTSIEKITPLLEAEGLAPAWRRLLRTHVTSKGDVFAYILDAEPFKHARCLPEDLLAGLSIGEISVLYEYSLAYVDRKNRKDLGQYFTPDDVAAFMGMRAKKIDPHGEGVWVDPCSGVGNLAYQVAKLQDSPETFVKEKLYLVDIDPLALLIARILFTVHFQDTDANFFNKIESRFIRENFLSGEELPKFDYAILNPPYVVVEPDGRFETADARDLYAYFLERVTKSASRGFVSVTPQSFTNGNKFLSLRRLLLSEPREISVYCFDNVPDSLFKGYKFGSDNTNTANSTRAAITVSRKGVDTLQKITPLLRWRSKERANLLASAQDFLTPTKFSETCFPKLTRETERLYRRVKKFPPLGASLVRDSKFRLYIPATPRYFISALKSAVNRTSTRVIAFHNEEDMDRAYMLLNSSYMYWWWRVNDGGMTISEKTLRSLPFLTDISVDRVLVRALELSERQNKVYKKNAGKMIENIRHDQELVHMLNRSIFPKDFAALEAMHNNSVFTPVNSQTGQYAFHK